MLGLLAGTDFLEKTVVLHSSFLLPPHPLVAVALVKEDERIAGQQAVVFIEMIQGLVVFFLVEIGRAHV